MDLWSFEKTANRKQKLYDRLTLLSHLFILAGLITSSLSVIPFASLALLSTSWLVLGCGLAALAGGFAGGILVTARWNKLEFELKRARKDWLREHGLKLLRKTYGELHFPETVASEGVYGTTYATRGGERVTITLEVRNSRYLLLENDEPLRKL